MTISETQETWKKALPWKDQVATGRRKVQKGSPFNQSSER
jgi:hypothetical protein